MPPKRSVNVKISSRININTTYFNGECWYHLNDNKKNKSVSFTRQDLKAIFEKKDELKAASKKVIQIHHSGITQVKKKSVKSTRNISGSSSEDGENGLNQHEEYDGCYSDY